MLSGMSALKKLGLCVVGGATTGGSALVLSFEQTIKATGTDADRHLHSPSFIWPHTGFGKSYDSRSIRRGYEVYKQVCASCHGCFTVNFRMMGNVCMTMEEAKAEARRATYIDGPDDTGAMFERPGTLVDYLPEPYANSAAAAYANNGKSPPNLALITKGRAGHGGENYIFSLLTGYMEPPTGYKIDDGLHFNPYFHGGAIAMPPPLYNEVIEYSDGTPATKSQCAKDVTQFLSWACEPWHDSHQKLMLKFLPLISMMLISAMYVTRRSVMNLYTVKYVFTKPLKK